MGTTRGLERLVFFTDAVVAIAITLLILPLIDPIPEFAKQHDSVGAFVGDNIPQLVSFFVSFAVIARLWAAHHAIFEHVVAYTHSLMSLSLFWALTVVFLPLPTSMTAEFTSSPLGVGLYIGTMALSSCALTAMALIVQRHPAVGTRDSPIDQKMVHATIATSASFLVALVIGVLVPAINYWALLILVASGPLSAHLARRQRVETVRPDRRDATS